MGQEDKGQETNQIKEITVGLISESLTLMSNLPIGYYTRIESYCECLLFIVIIGTQFVPTLVIHWKII